MNLQRTVAALALGLGAACGGASSSPTVKGPTPPGLAEKVYATMQVDAADELQCPQEQLTYEPMPGERHLIKGCGQSVEMFFLSYSDANNFRVGPSPANRFSKETRCALLESKAERAQRDTFVVDGCGRRITYVLLCPMYQRCTWVADRADAP